MRAGIWISVCLLLAGCASTPPMVWMRTDGRPMATDAALAQQYQIDRTVCLGDREKADLSGVTVTNGGLAGLAASIDRSNAADAVFSGCMAQKGYILVKQDQVPTMAAQLTATNAERQALAPTHQ